MIVIVKHTPTGRRFVLVGTGYDAIHPEQSIKPLRDAKSVKDVGGYAVAAVCDEDGAIYWCETKELVVESIDGRAPQAILKQP
ncbi:hypothetical protein K8I31_03470 [bacterium]|nr:hypothetical protein [bacterium]